MVNDSATTCAGSAVADSYGQVPGGPGRWTLVGVEGGLESMADMYSTANTLANDMTLYTTLQGITMQLLILRLIKVLSAQKRLSILTTTAIKVTALLLNFDRPMPEPLVSVKNLAFLNPTTASTCHPRGPDCNAVQHTSVHSIMC